MIRWVTERLGTAPAHDRSITDDMAVVDVRDLVDKSGNSPTAAREKIDQGLASMRNGRRVVVCCDYGISRSNAIAAGILSAFLGKPLDGAIKEVMEATGEKEIKLELLRSVRMALQENEEEVLDVGPRVLVTGGTGFIGQNLVRKLGPRCFVIAPTRKEADLALGAMALGLLVKENRISCIVHLAGPRVYSTNSAIGETITMLRNVLDVCRENGTRLIYPSNWEVYSGHQSTDMVANENTRVCPKGPYGETKALCENLIQVYRKLYGIRCGLLRPSAVYGTDRPRFLHNFIAKARSNDPIKTHCYLNGNPKLDLLHIDDFVRALIAATETEFAETANVGTGALASTREIAEFIASEVGSNSVISSQYIKEHAANVAMDYSLASGALNWRPSIRWEAGIRQLLTDK